MLVKGEVWRQLLARRRGGRLRLRALQRFFSSLHYCPARPATSERGAADIYIYIYIQLPAAFPPPCPEQIPQDPFWVPWAPAGLPFRYPWAPPWALFGGLGHLLVSPWTPFGTRTKKETKSDMEDPRFGVQVGTQNRHFSGKSGNKHEKMGSQTGSGKRVLS